MSKYVPLAMLPPVKVQWTSSPVVPGAPNMVGVALQENPKFDVPQLTGQPFPPVAEDVPER